MRYNTNNITTVRKLSAMPYAQAHVEIAEDCSTYLFSYTTLVAYIEGGTLYINGLYSQTTRKHISAFLKEYLNLPYIIAKTCYLNHTAYFVEERVFVSLDTGEILGDE